jgi:hypothetical protein
MKLTTFCLAATILPIALPLALSKVPEVPVAAATPAVARTEVVRNKDNNPHRLIVQAVKEAGYSAELNSPECSVKANYHGFVVPKKRRFVLCLENIPNGTAVFTTIRHEALHVAQDCHGGPLWPQYQDLNIARAQDEGWDILSYPTKQWAAEAEARVMANELDAQEVAEVVSEACSPSRR